MLLRLKYVLSLFAVVLLINCPKGAHIVVKESVEDLQKAVEDDPNDHIAFYNLGVAYVAEDRYDEALESFRKVIDIEPHFSDAYFAMYCIEYTRDRELYDESLKEEPDPDMKNKINKVDSYLASAIMYDPFFDWKISTILLDKKPSAHGNIYLKEFIDAVYERFLDGFIQCNLGNYEKAVDKLNFIIEMNPEFTQAYLVRGFANMHVGNFEKAIEDFRFVIDEIEEYNEKKILPVYLNPAELYYIIGCIHLKAGKPDKAEETFKRVIMENMGFYMAHHQLSNIYDKRNSFTGCLQEMNAAINAKPNDPVFHFNKGVYLSRFGRAMDAMNEYKEAINLNPNYSKPYFNLALVLEALGKREEAAENYQNFIDKAPKRFKNFIDEAKNRKASLE